MGPSSTKGAMIPLARRPATTVVVFDGRGLPVAKGRGIDQALAPGAPAVEAGHRCGCGGLVDEDEALTIHGALPPPPAAPVPGHVGPILLGPPRRHRASPRPRRPPPAGAGAGASVQPGKCPG